MTSPADDYGEPISTYTDDQAIDDGFLVVAAPDQYGPKILLSRAVFEVLDADTDDQEYLQKVIPLIQDALMICRARPHDHLWTRGLDGNVTGRDVWIALNGRGGITLMFAEDY